MLFFFPVRISSCNHLARLMQPPMDVLDEAEVLSSATSTSPRVAQPSDNAADDLVASLDGDDFAVRHSTTAFLNFFR
jgi:hypothetical protein